MAIFRKEFKVGDRVLARLDDEHVVEGVIDHETDYEFYVVSSDDNGCYSWTFDKAKANKYFRKVKSRGRKKV